MAGGRESFETVDITAPGSLACRDVASSRMSQVLWEQALPAARPRLREEKVLKARVTELPPSPVREVCAGGALGTRGCAEPRGLADLPPGWLL